jgi:hypothetical protein
MEDTVLHWKYRAASRLKRMGMHKRTRNGHGARVGYAAAPFAFTFIHSFMALEAINFNSFLVFAFIYFLSSFIQF